MGGRLGRGRPAAGIGEAIGSKCGAEMEGRRFKDVARSRHRTRFPLASARSRSNGKPRSSATRAAETPVCFRSSFL